MRNDNKNRQLTIMIIDHDPTYLKLWGRIFNRLVDCSYNITNNPDIAMELIKKKRFDLIITEALFPQLDGYKIAALANKCQPNADILMTTSYDCNINRFNIKNPRFNILYKPYNDINDIEKFVSALLHHDDMSIDISEDSFSENEFYPEIREWKL